MRRREEETKSAEETKAREGGITMWRRGTGAQTAPALMVTQQWCHLMLALPDWETDQPFDLCPYFSFSFLLQLRGMDGWHVDRPSCLPLLPCHMSHTSTYLTTFLMSPFSSRDQRQWHPPSPVYVTAPLWAETKNCPSNASISPHSKRLNYTEINGVLEHGCR